MRVSDRLADREIAGGGDGHDCLAGLLEEMQLAKRGDVVDARIGAGIGDHHETFADKDAHAIGHSEPLGFPVRCGDYATASRGFVTGAKC